ncbi:hypothetical protein EDB87DRAFT_1620735 [Lactarius vividus]|nr:hypothetical protein EDB87DRAFT_1620735 [Lactarius vividus]
MSRLRPSPTPTLPPSTRPLRVVAVGTLFLTHTLSLPSHPAPAKTIRAHDTYALGEEARPPSSACSPRARVVTRELEADGVSTRYCKVWDGAGVPAAWVLYAGDTNSQSVFVSLMGPLLIPEHYPSPESPLGSPTLSPPPLSLNNGAPFEWIHFEGRSVKTTLSNLQGLDGLARERRWRSQCVFSVDIGRRAKQGIEALIPHADVLFLNRHYAQTQSPAYASAPRAFLLALTRLAPPHALLVAYWGVDGAAALSVPTREYFQSSGWSAPPTPATSTSPSSPLSATTTPSTPGRHHPRSGEEAQSVRSGSGFWAAGHESSQGSSAFSASQLRHLAEQSASTSVSAPPQAADNDSGDDSDCTEIAGGSSNDGSRAQGPAGQTPASGARGKQQPRSSAQTIRRVLPGAPYVPGLAGSTEAQRTEGGRWKLDECLRFATELAGRRARRRTWDGLGEEMVRAGWFDA